MGCVTPSHLEEPKCHHTRTNALAPSPYVTCRANCMCRRWRLSSGQGPLGARSGASAPRINSDCPAKGLTVSTARGNDHVARSLLWWCALRRMRATPHMHHVGRHTGRGRKRIECMQDHLGRHVVHLRQLMRGVRCSSQQRGPPEDWCF
eukprot:scaffold17629_cov34-Tisochrysis_lutea.AAC.3